MCVGPPSKATNYGCEYKCDGPTTCLGIEIDTVAGELRLHLEKLESWGGGGGTRESVPRRSSSL